MSEIENRLHALRDELHDNLPVPDVDRLAGRVRSRRRTQVGAIVAVVAAALAVPVLRALPDGSQAAAPPPPSSSVVDFADARHGYALTSTCPDSGRGCTVRLYATGDGGRTWQPRTLPPPANPTTGHAHASLDVVGPDRVALNEAKSGGLVRRISDDGGRSWRELDRWFAEEPSAALPDGGLLTGLCDVQPSPGECDVLGTVRPDGVNVALLDQPALEQLRVGPAPTKDGRFWAVGRQPVTGRWAVAVSGDRGRTWTTSELDLGGRVPRRDGWSVVERNGVMYATATSYDELLGVWHSTDDGRSWERTWPDRAHSLPGLAGTPIAAGDGTLVLSDGRTTYVSTDQGRTFRRTGDKVAGTVKWTRAGYLRSAPNEYALSTDGLHWRTFTVS